MAASPAFMSPAPRPYSHSPSRRAAKGGLRHREDGSGLTTSMWPLRINERPSAGPAGSHVARTFVLPATSQLNGAPPGWRSSVARSRGTSKGSSPSSAKARRMIAWPGPSWPSTVAAWTSSASSSTIAGSSAATAASISASIAGA
jgi:hypothetical protein